MIYQKQVRRLYRPRLSAVVGDSTADKPASMKDPEPRSLGLQRGMSQMLPHAVSWPWSFD